MMTNDLELLRQGRIRMISAKRKRKLQKRGIICWWSHDLDSWVWDSRDMADGWHVAEGWLKNWAAPHERRMVAK